MHFWAITLLFKTALLQNLYKLHKRLNRLQGKLKRLILVCCGDPFTIIFIRGLTEGRYKNFKSTCVLCSHEIKYEIKLTSSDPVPQILPITG